MIRKIISWAQKFSPSTYIVWIILRTVPWKLFLVPWQFVIGDQPLVEIVVGGANDVLPVAVHYTQHEVALSVALNKVDYISLY